MKPKWDKQECGCVKANLTRAGKVMIRCSSHRGKPSKRLLCYFGESTIVTREAVDA